VCSFRASINQVLVALVLGVASALAGSAKLQAACVGDCGGDGRVTINELVVGVRIALEALPLERCASIDVNGDGRVAVSDLVAAVRALLDGCPGARLIVLEREGRIASLDVTAPWTPRATSDLGAVIGSARCGYGRCLVTHPADDSISIVDPDDLSNAEPIALARGSEPRDVALIDEHTVVVSLYGRAELLAIDLRTRDTETIDLTPLADTDGLPETQRLAHCGRRVFAQLRRVDHKSGAPAPIGAALAIVDFDRAKDDRLVDTDPETAGVQGIALAGRPNFDMPVDCAAGLLYVAEPAPLLQGGSKYEQVDLEALRAGDLGIDIGAEAGGFEVVEPGVYWLITHTEFGPGPSSHLNLLGGVSSDTHNTFANEHVNDLALDRDEDLLFFPDPCSPSPVNQECDTGIHIFHAHTGLRAAERAVDPGFAPIELAVSR